MVVVLVVAANLAHSAVGIREINNNPAGFSDGSDDHQVSDITNSLKNNPLYDIMPRGGRLPHDQRLSCSKSGKRCGAPSECCSGRCARASYTYYKICS
ncbi:hypothetical protein Tsubulata_049889 [Turnera subulata]|uniref:Uncharacterized protein n=1 Tax=Turnera subulata TaxID=218843 RepID=A0A9Q0JLP2_9ROSI|nr:hypothetical protein Tsubulata_049889 [Turnera subulata]